MSEIERVAAPAWRAAIERALAGGERFGGAWASGPRGHASWRALLISEEQARVVSCAPVAGEIETIVDLVEMAAFDEREAHDLHGLEFAGHSPMRALVAHPPDPARWMTPVSGDGVHQVAVGPVHAGVIESGHFRFHVVGERILAMDLRLFYKHRGLERAAEGLRAEDALAHAGRACAACSVTNTVAYAQALESARGQLPDRALRVQRTVLLELERLYNHLHDIGAVCAGVGFAPGAMAFAALKDRAQQLNARAFAHRFLFDTVHVGGGTAPLDRARRADALESLRELRTDNMPPRGRSCIIFPRAATSRRASSSENTPAMQAAANSPILWPSMAAGRIPQLIQSCASAYSIVKIAGCAMTVSVTRRFASSDATSPG